MERIPIRLKVAATLVVPLLMLLVVSALEVRQAGGELAEVRDEAQLARAVTGPSGAITRIQDERTWAVLELTGLDTSVDEIPMVGYDETRAATDEALRTFRADVESHGGAVEATFRDALDASRSLTDIRREIDGFSSARTVDNIPFSTDIWDRYSELVDAFLDASADITGQVEDTELRQGTRLAVLASQQVELDTNLSRATITAAIISPGGIDTPEEVTSITSMLGRFERDNARIEGTTGAYAAVVRDTYPAAYVSDLRRLVTTAVETGTVEDLDAWLDAVSTQPETGYPLLREAVSAEITDRADLLTAQASARQRVFVILAAVVFAVAAVLTLVVSRSIAGSLQSLTEQAQDVAQRRLPGAVRHILETPPGEDVRLVPISPVEVTSHDEVADVARALNTAQKAALDLAVEQAVLRRNVADSFVNLGRRNQNLLRRQLDFITVLESRETDPETLAALFRLDHLATRMRRNAESLLVLAGVDSPRTWAGPVHLSDVIRAALGEVEGYERVRLDWVAPATLHGSAVADLTHLLAELVENALAFSATIEVVVVSGTWGEPEGYRLTVADHGEGISPDELVRANARLAGDEALTAAPSRSLGHHVAGSLAARHGIRVRLESAPLAGTVATVDLPGHLVAQVDQRAASPAALSAPPAVLSTPPGGPR